ncbi:MAG: hypothetical protein OEZ25_05400 [Candidatus Bathyarchaeota archaeon]|nr:hypothetical protein [Candidatus Bathyarchaeota archaeon]
MGTRARIARLERVRKNSSRARVPGQDNVETRLRARPSRDVNRGQRTRCRIGTPAGLYRARLFLFLPAVFWFSSLFVLGTLVVFLLR